MFLLRTRVATAPITTPVSVDDLKAHSRIDSDDEGVYLDGLIRMATRRLQNETNRVFITQTIEGFADTVPPEPIIRLVPGPVQSVTTVSTFSSTDVETAIANTTYRVDAVGGRVHLNYGQVWPSGGLRDYDAFYVKWIAGYGLTTGSIPETITHAILLLAAHWFENREPLNGMDQPLPRSVAAMIYPYKIFLL